MANCMEIDFNDKSGLPCELSQSRLPTDGIAPLFVLECLPMAAHKFNQPTNFNHH